MKNKFIVIEGTDSSGKETQTKRLIERLNSENIPCKTMSFPRYNTPTGRIIGECYLGKKGESWFGVANSVDSKTASLYYAADRRAAVPDIQNILKTSHLICDRYVESNMGHQGGKITNPEKREEFFRWLENLEYKFLELPKPDAVIFLYMPHQVSMELKTGMKEKPDSHESDQAHLKNAEQAYLQLANMYNWIKIDCSKNNSPRRIEDISEEVYQKLKPLLNL